MMSNKRECSKCGNPFNCPPEAIDIVDAFTSEDGKSGPLCPTCFKIWQESQPPPEETFVPIRESEYRFTSDMGEISGFGGGYEQTCRNMLVAGLEWFDKNPNADPQFEGFKDVYGIISEDNQDAKDLSKIVVEAADNDCTGAMHQAVITSCLWIRKNGWNKYCEEMRKED
jgi:hypothetical protein